VLHLVLGNGPVGSGLATALADRGHDVHVVTRSGTAPDHPRIRAVGLDASDGRTLARAAAGASTIVNCANPPYHRWHTDWPPLLAGTLAAAELSGAALVHQSNLYGHGPGAGVMTEDTPLNARPGTKGAVRADVWRQTLQRHDAGRIRAAEVRASDYFGPGAGRNSHLEVEVIGRAARGRAVWQLFGTADAEHSWSYLPDVVSTLVAVVEAGAVDGSSYGRAWMTPNSPARSYRQAAADVAELTGHAAPPVHVVPRAVTGALGLLWPVVREMAAERWQFDDPFVAQAPLTTATFGLEPTPWRAALTESLRARGFDVERELRPAGR
jgi:nucleoside-diphosphate-sugar epimerase